MDLTRTDWIKIFCNLFIGFLTILLQSVIPIGGGGISLIFVITVPTTIGLSIISSLVYFGLAKKNRVKSKNIVVYTTICLNLLITFSMYPYDN